MRYFFPSPIHFLFSNGYATIRASELPDDFASKEEKTIYVYATEQEARAA